MKQNQWSSLWELVRLVTIVWVAGAGAALAAESRRPDPDRVEQLARLLPASPRGVGRTINDRAAWQAVARAPRFNDVVRWAERLTRAPMPALTDQLYLDFSRTGNRSRCQRVISQRHGRIGYLVLAECIENRGRFLPAIEAAIRDVCSEKSWLLPAHDRRLRNFNGTVVEIDLEAAYLGWNLATADYWLGEKLSGDARQLIRSQLERRIYQPFEGMVTEGKPRLWWLTGTNNWNAVCLAGVTGAALALIEPPPRRAFFVASAEKHVQNLISGYTDDGYCTEGIGYWNYGFGHYTMLAETIYQATGGQVDLLRGDKIKRVAQFGHRMEILPGVYPAFADCHLNTHPDVQLVAFLSRRLGLGFQQIERRGLLLAAGPSARLFALGLFGFPNSATERAAADVPESSHPLRDWFPDAGVLICRPAAGSRRALGAALKGGHNAEHHNHNDVGSFVVALGDQTPLVDPGSEIYTRRTFSAKRYESDVLNSFGHPVPRVAGQLQKSGRSAAAKVLQAEFSDTTDSLLLDIRSAYGVKGLKLLQRQFRFSRQGGGRLAVSDHVQFDQPQSFGTALVTFDNWRRLAPDRLLIGDGPAAVRVEVRTEGHDFKITAERIREELPGGRLPTRLGIDLLPPAREATITLTVTPASQR